MQIPGENVALLRIICSVLLGCQDGSDPGVRGRDPNGVGVEREPKDPGRVLKGKPSSEPTWNWDMPAKHVRTSACGSETYIIALDPKSINASHAL